MLPDFLNFHLCSVWTHSLFSKWFLIGFKLCLNAQFFYLSILFIYLHVRSALTEEMGAKAGIHLQPLEFCCKFDSHWAFNERDRPRSWWVSESAIVSGEKIRGFDQRSKSEGSPPIRLHPHSTSCRERHLQLEPKPGPKGKIELERVAAASVNEWPKEGVVCTR